MPSIAAAAPIRQVSLGILAGYTIVTTILLVPVVLSAASGGLPFLYIALLIAILFCLNSDSRVAAGLGDWLPLIALPVLYACLPLLIGAVGSGLRDAVVQRWEMAIFGTQLARTLASAVPAKSASETLHAAYLSYYPMIYVPPVAMALSGDRPAMHRSLLAITATYVLCFSIYIVFPVEGPRYLWGSPTGVPSGLFRSTAVGILAAASSRGAAFPSSHVAVSLAQALAAFAWRRWVGALLLGVTVLLAIGAVYGGFHYGVDTIAGALVGIVGWGVSRAVAARHCLRPRAATA